MKQTDSQHIQNLAFQNILFPDLFIMSFRSSISEYSINIIQINMSQQSPGFLTLWKPVISVTRTIQLFYHDYYHYRGSMYSRIASNSEAFVSLFLLHACILMYLATDPFDVAERHPNKWVGDIIKTNQKRWHMFWSFCTGLFVMVFIERLFLRRCIWWYSSPESS